MVECGRVMIVDDEYIMRQGIKYMINWEEYGFSVVGEASNGREALDLMEELKPNVVFVILQCLLWMDWTLSELSIVKYPMYRF